jgi:hypothetical protein
MRGIVGLLPVSRNMCMRGRGMLVDRLRGGKYMRVKQRGEEEIR